MSHCPEVLNPKADDVRKMLASEVHIGSTNIDLNMTRYVHKRRNDGIHIINLQKTWEKLVLAARIIVTIENTADVCVISSRQVGQRATLKFASYIGATAVSGRFTPGTFTNQTQSKFMEPRLLIVADPRADHQPVREAAYGNIPTIGFANTDSPLRYIDVAIPCNNLGKKSIGLMFWFLAREVLYLRSKIPRSRDWEIMVDLFLQREADDTDKSDKDENQITNINDPSIRADSSFSQVVPISNAWDTALPAWSQKK
eukprot:TRINITY_DN333_c3_g1_i1.p1 TRINITY_DN333_c3_g1~~TRINITY_DN333_c3_g1_i1.p1  ORF type:complete len:256 (-),score=136.06 TRINITY_DN333_c3_g1_i1:134-901(-)